MILNYKNFLTEKIENNISNLLLEGKVYFSNELLSSIEKLSQTKLSSSVNKLADLLIDSLGKNIDGLNIGLLDFSGEGEDKLKFIPEDKIKKYIEEKGKRDFNSLNTPFIKNYDLLKGYTWMKGYSKEILSDLSGNSIKIGRVIRKILKSMGKLDQFSDKDIEDFVNIIKSEKKKKENVFGNFDIVKGEDIRKYYHCKKYLNSKGTLGSSCMRNEEQQDYLDIYVKNPDKIEMVILRSNDNPDKIVGRALLWTLDNHPFKFMDRIYTSYDSDVNLFKDYAIQNRWAYKKAPHIIYPPDYNSSSSIRLIMSVSLKPIHYDEYPYLDTFKFYDHINGEISNSQDLISSNVDEYLELEHDGGYFFKHP